jgi:hypothetical protein
VSVSRYSTMVSVVNSASAAPFDPATPRSNGSRLTRLV